MGKARITKTAIHAALGVGETWLSEAIVGHRLVKEYGPEGSHSAHEVLNELAAERELPQGRSHLLNYMKAWEKSHP